MTRLSLSGGQLWLQVAGGMSGRCPHGWLKNSQLAWNISRQVHHAVAPRRSLAAAVSARDHSRAQPNHQPHSYCPPTAVLTLLKLHQAMCCTTASTDQECGCCCRQQKHVKQWLEAAASGMHVLDNSLGGPSSSSPAADGAADKAGRTRTASATGPGVAAILGQGSTWVGQQQAAAAGSMHIVPGPAGDAAAGGGSAELAPSKAYAAALDGARRRARSHSPVRSRHTVAEAAAGAAKPRPSANLADEFSKLLQLQGAAEGRGARDGTDKASAAAAVQRLSQALLAASEPAADHSGVSVGLQAAAAAVLDQLKALGAQQGGYSSK